jgi:hypothetical protein
MEVGFVPITVVERKREKPANCEVILGEITEEPSPLPADYYEGHAWDGGWYDNEICPENPESGAPFSYPGTIFGYPIATDDSYPHGHQVPLRDDVASSLSVNSPTCGLSSDP